MANKIEVEVRTDDASDYSAIEAKAAEAGAATGAAFEAGASAPILSLADRMRAGYDTAFSEMEAGTRGFTDAQLSTFKDYYSELAGQGDRSAADMLTRVRSLGGDAEVAAEEVATAVSTSLGNGFQDAGTASGGVFTRAFTREASAGVADFSVLGAGLDASAATGGSGFAVKFSTAAKDGIEQANIAGMLGTDQTFTSLGEKAGDDFAEGFTAKAADPTGGGGKAPTSGKGSGGSEDSGGEGMGGLMVAGLVAGAAIGAPAIEAALGGAMTVVTGLALKSNATIAADYTQLGHTITTTFEQAAAPVAGTFHEALMSVDQDVQHLGPGLQNMFAAAEPDITAVTTGVEGFANSALPGMTSALSGGQVIVADFAASMPGLGSSVGGFFQGLDTDATTTGAGLQSVFGVLGNAVGTLGHVLGSASSAISTDLLAIDPVVNTVLTTVRQLTNPATIGAGAGAFAAFKLDPSISSGLASASTKMLDLSDHAGIASGALLKSSSALDTMSGVMSGPWGVAIGAGVGLLSGLVGSMMSASHASDALTLSQEGLQKAIAQDGGGAGAATAAYVAQSAAQDGLSASAAKAGVSLATWTSAVTGSKQAQAEVTAAVEKLNAAQLNQITTNDKNAQDLRGGTTVSNDMAAQSADRLTTSNQQLLSSMRAEASQIASTIVTQQNLNAATMILNNNTQIFNATLSAAQTAAQLQYQTAAQSSVALLGLGVDQSTLNMQLVNSESAYATATGAAGSYNTVLSSLNGSATSFDQAQNTLAQDMITASTSFKQNGQSLDLSTQAGVNNRQAVVSAAAAITAMGVQTYQATGNINTANATIQSQVNAFVKATGATGTAKTAIEQYITSLTKIPPNVTTTVTANTTQAQNAVSSLQNQFDQLDRQVAAGGSIAGLVTITSSGSKTTAHYATGGAVSTAATGGGRSGMVQMDEQGAELVNLPNGAQVMPASNVQSMAASGALGGGNGIVQLEFIGGPADHLGAAIWAWFKENIRATGGRGAGAVDRALVIN